MYQDYHLSILYFINSDDIDLVDNVTVRNVLIHIYFQYLKTLSIKTEPLNFDEEYKFADPNAVDLMKKMLVFSILI